MLETLKKQVYEANMELVKRGLVLYTWGNASGIDREKGLIVIKPSGVDYADMKPEDMVVVDMNGKAVEGRLRPSSDTLTHVVLYNAFEEIGGIVHTHSTHAVAWAQAGLDIPALGTTHADYFYGSIPCTRDMTAQEIEGAYEANTGHVIVETFNKRNISPMFVPAVICKNHGPFAWGKDVDQAVYHSVVLEEVARMAALTRNIFMDVAAAPESILKKHFTRKHGEGAYYGQN